MRNKPTFYLLLFCITFLSSYQSTAQQPWQIEHSQLNSPYLSTENSKPNPTAFDNMIGATGGKEIGNGFFNGFNAKGVINNFRSFHLMEADFGDSFFPKEKVLHTIDCDGDCADTQIIPDFATGEYSVKVNQGGTDGTYCYKEERIQLENGSSSRNKEFDFADNLVLYPNPARDRINNGLAEFSRRFVVEHLK